MTISSWCGRSSFRLKHDSEWHQFGDWYEQSQQIVKFQDQAFVRAFSLMADEIMWQLIAQGVITPGIDTSNSTLPFFRITAYGQSVLEAERMIPHDPTGYLADVDAAATSLVGSKSIAYIEEALRCFNAGCHVASVLLLGVASESVFLDLCTSIEAGLKSEPERTKFTKLRQVKEKHQWVVEKFRNLPNEVKRNDLPESLDLTLVSLYDLIRRQRNELGHPQETLPDISREQAFIFFKLFPQFLRDARAFAEYATTTGL